MRYLIALLLLAIPLQGETLIKVEIPYPGTLFSYLRDQKHINREITNQDKEALADFLNNFFRPERYQFTQSGPVGFYSSTAILPNRIIESLVKPEEIRLKNAARWFFQFNHFAIEDLQTHLHNITPQEPRDKKIIQDARLALTRMTTEITRYHADEEALKTLLKSELLASLLP